MVRAVVGIIGGSGVYHLPGLQDLREERVSTPWGDPSDALHFGRIGETEVIFLPRHGRGHVFSPSGINYRANIYALKQAGVTDLVSVSACGSFKSELYPGLFVLPDQFVDRTFGRQSTFFGNGCVAHVSMAHPVAPLLAERIAAAARAENIEHSVGGTYVCMEGPQFSSYAESLTYKGAGYDVIGMTAMPEAKLAREAELSYATIAMVTDFDCWHPEHDNVDVAAVIQVVRSNADKASRLLARLLADFPQEHEPCPIGSDRALDNAILTAPGARDAELMKKLGVIVERVSAAA
ncbi:S-methyl-5'-thioadenosine phosphorylase [Methylosinus sp. Ce-a6]|uniref:S-methyl-5'-thioadenosine phosphorylase n=1 Tax=Methylosinus sp. Ce-a6 TaxID=2172005 RepID=UPI001357E225|nr:S-methyl-5'-thioadenosine phosphorylase [Methylosinus sp. Ce-a6]